MNFITLTSGLCKVKNLSFTNTNGAFTTKILLLEPFLFLTVAVESWLGKRVDD